MKKGTKHSAESRRKMREAMMGNKSAVGMKHSEESREKMRQAKLGIERKPFTEEHKQRISEALKKHRQRMRNEKTTDEN